MCFHRLILFIALLFGICLNANTAQSAPGQATYEHFCIACHQDGVAGAPKIHDEADWNPRLANKTIKDLVTSATKGLNNMPAQGTCSECDEEELKATIEYMLPKS